MRTSMHEIEQVVRTLTAEQTLDAVELGGAEEQAWTDCDLAALAELRLGQQVDARQIRDAQRADWARRAITEELWTPTARDELERCFWVRVDGRRAGTVALATTALGGSLVRLSSLYLYPAERGRGAARRLLERIVSALGARGLGIRLETCWTWSATLRFYLELGMWVRMWKRDLDLWLAANAPRPVIDVDPRVATLSVDHEGERIALVRAERDGDRLVAFEHCVDGARPGSDEGTRESALDAVVGDAGTTLAVELARRGWPLLRTPGAWRPRWKGDGGDPEGLAYRIVCWEAWAKARGWRVETPRVAGLPCPTWEELEAEWPEDELE